MSYPLPQTVSAIVLTLCLSTITYAEEKAEKVTARNIIPSSSAAFISTVDTSTLTGKVMVTYNGWYNIDGDRADRGWLHWAKNRLEPVGAENVGVELFPDLSEFGPEERFKTSILKPDGNPVEIYSSLNKDTVNRHFQWMHDYRIDGAFIKRFALDLQHPRSTIHADTVLANVRVGAAAAGRAYAIMYELDGLGPGKVDMLINDWQDLDQVRKITEDAAYLKHEGKPIVGILGVGFNDRDYSLEECRKLMTFIKDQGCALMVGTSANWRTDGGDSIADPLLLELLQTADIISPQTIAHYKTPREARGHGADVWKPERAWCDARGIDYLPMIFPGFSRGARFAQEGDLVPRQHGKLIWAQFQSAKSAGCRMAIVASFDGMHNGTAILKFDKTAPKIKDLNGIGFEDIPSDYYLKLTGDGGMLIKNAIARRATVQKNPLQYSSVD